jgi:hypothetical protein
MRFRTLGALAGASVRLRTPDALIRALAPAGRASVRKCTLRRSLPPPRCRPLTFAPRRHAPGGPYPSSSSTAAAKASVCRSAADGGVTGEHSAMLWNGVISTPRLSACRWR